jgi:hypothetical protein
MRWTFIVGLGVPMLVAAGAAGALVVRRGAAPDQASRLEPAPSAHGGCQDRDGDGYGLGCALGPDCNDLDATVHPGAGERCNFRDDDCDGVVDDFAGCEAPPLDSSRIRVPDGRFRMGSMAGAIDEQPVRSVKVSSFELDRYEVTNRRYAECVGQGLCSPPALRSSHRRASYYGDERFGDYPVIFVTWHQADAFCRHAGGRLPSEAEWEKAARGSTGPARTFPWGNEPADCSRANMGGPGSCANDTDRVGRRLLGQSPYGAFDLAGNVWEWVGGADTLRVSCRKAELPTTLAYNVGFRCAYPKGR